MIDGLVRSGRSSGMSNAQLREAGENLAGQLREAATSNPLIAHYFPAAADGLNALARSLETALSELTASVPGGLSRRIDRLYSGIMGRDKYGIDFEIGPLLRKQLVKIARDHDGSSSELDDELRQHILRSEEVKQGRQSVVASTFDRLLGRKTTYSERRDLARWANRRLDDGASFEVVAAELQNRVMTEGKWGDEYRKMERVGLTYMQTFQRGGPVDSKTKRKWVTWVDNAMSKYGLSENQAFQYLPLALQGKL